MLAGPARLPRVPASCKRASPVPRCRNAEPPAGGHGRPRSDGTMTAERHHELIPCQLTPVCGHSFACDMLSQQLAAVASLRGTQRHPLRRIRNPRAPRAGPRRRTPWTRPEPGQRPERLVERRLDSRFELADLDTRRCAGNRLYRSRSDNCDAATPDEIPLAGLIASSDALRAEITLLLPALRRSARHSIASVGRRRNSRQNRNQKQAKRVAHINARAISRG